MAKNPSILLLSPPMRMSYPKLWKPEPFKDPVTGVEKGDPVYSTEFMVPADDISKFRTWDEEAASWRYDHLHNFCLAMAAKRFGDDFDATGAIQHGGISWPVASDEKYIAKRISKNPKLDREKLAHYDGNFVVNAKALSEINGRINAPTLYYMEGEERKTIVRGTDQGAQLCDSMFYGGGWAVAELSAVAGTAGDNKYVTLYINSIIFIRHDEKFGGGNRLMDRFEGITGGESDIDPTEGMSDEINI